jgi:diguanylate cyclase (GGDEF)-like protein
VFNPAQYSLATLSAALVVTIARGSATLADPLTHFAAGDLGWAVLSWAVWIAVNFALVGGVLTGPSTFIENVTEDFRHEVWLNFAVLAISPLIIVVGARHWMLLPLLLIPLVLLYQTARIALEREHEAGHDALTGLPNRVTLGLALDEAFAGHEHAGDLFALMLIDLNDFKRINDTLGPQVGDALLVSFAERLQDSVRPEDCVARLGGDEFAVLVFDVDEAGALAVAERICETVAPPIVIGSIDLEVTLSLGIAICPKHGVDGTTLLRRADVAMYLAKELRTGIEIYSVERDENSADQLELVGELRRALDAGQLELHYQPKVAASDSQPVGFEALARWTHPVRGNIPPDRFIALAERSGVMPILTARVVELALQQSVTWQRLGIALPIAVNVSPNDLSGDRLVPLIDSLLQRYGVDPSMLVLEITERVSTTQIDDAIRNLDRLQALGVRISLDDFGTGYSSLARLRMLRVDEIKIDRMFVSALTDCDEGASIVRALIDLAHARHLPVVAEGVENAEQWRLLADLGCDVIQGWQVAHPMAAEDATAWIQARLAYTPPAALPTPTAVHSTVESSALGPVDEASA